MDPVRRLMDIIDTYAESMSNNDYIQACDILKDLHANNVVPLRRIPLKKKMKILLHKIDEVDPDMVPIFAHPYTQSQLEYTEWICSELCIDVARLYATSSLNQ